jgi:uncharacterized phage-associated protein
MKAWFNARKAAQVAAFFAQKEGGCVNVLKLTKLIYLADREHMKKYDFPIIGDELVSMPHGPVNSMTLNYIDGFVTDNKGWDEFITDRDNHCVGLTNKKITIDDLDELSEAEVATLQDVWKTFGGMGQFEIRDWTHQHCPEWEDPNGSSNPIPYERVFKYLGKSNPEMLGDNVKEGRSVNEAFSAL